uniref:Secreted protein n=1 Tax=Plectus sambesii TaxID=2011161 RepID=A0A914VBK8_9BILA
MELSIALRRASICLLSAKDTVASALIFQCAKRQARPARERERERVTRLPSGRPRREPQWTIVDVVDPSHDRYDAVVDEHDGLRAADRANRRVQQFCGVLRLSDVRRPVIPAAVTARHTAHKAEDTKL